MIKNKRSRRRVPKLPIPQRLKNNPRLRLMYGKLKKRLAALPWLRITAIFSVICLVAGYVLLSVTIIAQRGTYHKSVTETNTYIEKTAALSSEQRVKLKAALDAYDRSLSTGNMTDPFVPNGLSAPPQYYKVLSEVSNTVLGQLSIPSINLNEPIHYGHGEFYLGNGVEHVASTAIPDDIMGINSVLAGHSGLNDATIFENLGKMKVGDTFQIQILDTMLNYKVDNISIVDPTAVNTLNAQANHNYVTLLTCWPIFINSRRLIVRGTLVSSHTIKPQTMTIHEPFNPQLFFVSLIPLAASLATAIAAYKAIKRLRNRDRHNAPTKPHRKATSRSSKRKKNVSA